MSVKLRCDSEREIALLHFEEKGEFKAGTDNTESSSRYC